MRQQTSCGDSNQSGLHWAGQVQVSELEFEHIVSTEQVTTNDNGRIGQ
jgi:hypothetical protein